MRVSTALLCLPLVAVSACAGSRGAGNTKTTARHGNGTGLASNVEPPDPGAGHSAPAGTETESPTEEAPAIVIEPVPAAVTVLTRPPFEAFNRDGVAKPTAVPLSLVERSKKKNQVVDTEAWFSDNQLELPAGTPVAGSPPSIEGANLVRVIPGEVTDLYLYADRNGRGYVAGVPHRLARYAPTFVFDMTSYGAPRTIVKGDERFVEMELTWAQARGDTLYVSHAHRTYAKSSHGENAYVTALHIPTGEVIWRSQPLVANSRNFIVYGDYVIAGYGFTAEPDYIYVLDRATGIVVNRTKIKSGPDYILRAGKTLFVRAYDTDYEFTLP